MEQHKQLDFQKVKMGQTNKRDGNVGLISHNVAKTVRSEILNKDRSDACEITDMFNKKINKGLTNEKQFVHDVIVKHDYQKKTSKGIIETTEFAIILVHEGILEVLQRFTSAVLQVNIDSTGSLVKSPTCHAKQPHNQSRILNHNIVARINNATFPLVEMISSMANTEAVCNMMRALKSILVKVPDLKIKFLVFISDWAPQNFNAICHIFNSCCLIDYLNAVYLNQPIKSPFPSFSYSCVSHFVHAISKYCEKHLSTDLLHTKSIIIQLFTSIMMADSFQNAFAIIREAIFIFFSRNSNQKLAERKQKLLQQISGPELRDMIKTANEDAEKFHFQSNNIETIFEAEISGKSKNQSLCYTKFLEIAKEAIEEAKSNNIIDSSPNKFYDPNGRNGVLFKLLDLKIAYICHYSLISITRDLLSGNNVHRMAS